MPAVVPAGALAYGMQLPVQAQSPLFAEPWERASGPDEIARVAQAADRAGCYYVAVCDHVGIPEAYAEKMSTVWYDTIATLGWLAGLTTQTRLLSHVFVLAYRHPLVAAKSFATLDVLSGGRVIAGVGAGHVAPEFAALGLDFSRRGALLDDALDVFEAALREQYLDGTGDGHSGNVGVAPRPVQRPRPPIWVGGSSAAAVRRAARHDGWLPQGTPRAKMPALITLLRETRTAQGLDDAFDVGAITEWLHVGTPSWDVGRPCLSGPAEQLADSLREFAAMGVRHIQVRFPSRTVDELVDQITAFGADVGPLLRDA